jgi:hypothetical protein
MSHKWLAVLVCCSVLAGLAVERSIIVRATDSAQITPEQTELPIRRETQVVPNSPEISFIDSQSPTCYLPAPGTSACYITWNYLYVTASSSNYIISMTIAIDNNLQAYHAGFFQTYMYVPGSMYGQGFKVNCGLPGTEGVQALGKTYNYTIRARETGGLGSANYGSVSCPGDVVKVYLPNISKP